MRIFNDLAQLPVVVVDTHCCSAAVEVFVVAIVDTVDDAVPDGDTMNNQLAAVDTALASDFDYKLERAAGVEERAAVNDVAPNWHNCSHKVAICTFRFDRSVLDGADETVAGAVNGASVTLGLAEEQDDFDCNIVAPVAVEAELAVADSPFANYFDDSVVDSCCSRKPVALAHSTADVDALLAIDYVDLASAAEYADIAVVVVAELDDIFVAVAAFSVVVVGQPTVRLPLAPWPSAFRVQLGGRAPALS